MELLSYNLPRDWNLFLFGDDHIGARLRHDHGWEQLVDMMHSKYGGLPAKNNFGIHHGDLIEAILTDDKRWCDSECSKEKTVFEQMAASRKALLPLRKKLLAVLDGNHTFKLHRFGKIAFDICKQLEIPEKYGTWSAKLIYKDKKDNIQFQHFCTHGSGSFSSVADDPVRRETNKKLSLKRKLKFAFGDTFLNSMGHTHQIQILPPTKELYIVTDKEKKLQQCYTGEETIPSGYIPPESRWYVNTGAFLKLYGNGFSGYAERAGYPPQELGFAICKIREKKIVSIDKVVLK
jgi:hypothetical protein